MEIRRFEMDDFDRLLDLAELMRYESPAFRDYEMDQGKLLALGQAAIDNADQVFGAVAIKDDEIIGFMLGMCTEHYFSKVKLACDLALYVAKQSRGGTAGMRLITAFEKWAVNTGASLLTMGISTGIDTDRTAALYAKLGMQEEGIIFKKRL